MIKLNDRDMKVINFVKEFKAVSASTIARLYFPSLATAERRLRKLVDNKKLYRSRDNILSEYIYYTKKPTNIKHCLKIAEVYSLLTTNNDIQLIKYKREYEIKYRNKSLRADLMAVIKSNGKLLPVLIEIDLTKAYNNKYTEYINSKHYQQLFPIVPKIIVISNRTPKTTIDISWYKLN